MDIFYFIVFERSGLKIDYKASLKKKQKTVMIFNFTKKCSPIIIANLIKNNCTEKKQQLDFKVDKFILRIDD